MNTNNFNNVGANNFLQQKTQFSPSYNGVLSSASTNNIVWVQGIEGAKAWQLNPNSMVILLDSEVEGKMYIKVSDNIGMSSLRIFNYVEELPSTENKVTINNDLDLTQYVRKDELQEILKELLNEQVVSTAENGTTNTTAPTTATNKPKVITISKKQS